MTEAKDREHVGYVWYETSFVIPESWSGKRIVLRFGSATHHAVCWLNGQEIIRHKGGFLPFDADITELIEQEEAAKKPVENAYRLTVALSNILDWTCLPSGEIVTKEGSGYPEGYHYQDTFFDFYNYAGIHRPVKLYTTPRRYIEDIVIETSLRNDFAEATVSCSITGTDSVKRILVLDEDGNTVAEKKEAGNQAELTVQAPQLWQPGKAYLYRLRVEGERTSIRKALASVPLK